ncbi:hypothetical protein NCS57_00123100 [Fusarium keratoplasticum]|uniref:Uncharacterized protein n=1 Tax=Fusarium keratoplasticum TaxID=1328300 RepID=A0ACC0RFL4_9HYPO|nr:hypothetical protein NCS57_00123100 [Fusarium keratoplasticum]KAI8684567.1 hypothetical protein NCS57_00123100 [Fusarium keratoplasticum]KAI8688679.1 hypothetical protein NCS55_00122100 [Fusarium keratoplasticum]
MAPRGGPRRSEAAEPQAFHQLGVRGRKTGVELIDTGERDEYGMQPLDDLLSSPERGPSKANQQYDDDDDDDQYDDDQGSEDMDIETSAGPGPRTLLKERSIPYPLPRSRSPVKTQLLSPARRNRNLEHLSSPTRRSIAEERDPTVTRKLDFGAKSSGRPRGGANGINGSLPEEEEEEDADETEDADEPEQEEEVSDNMDLLEQSLQMVEAMHGDSVSPEPEPEPEHSEPPSEEDEPPVKQPVAAKKGRGRPPRPKPVQQEPEEEPVEEEPVEEESEEDAAPVAPKRGRKPNKPAPQPKQPKAAPTSRKRRAEPEPEEDDQPEDEVSEPEPEESAPQAKKQRTAPVKPSKPAAKAVASKAPGRPKGRPPRSKAPAEEAGETSFAALQRGPPMPKSRGLVSVRHDAEEVRTTRSGRHSFKPLDWWRGDKVVQEEEEFDGVTGRDKFVLTTIKEVIRKPQEEAPVKKARGRAKGRPKRAPEVELEDWELNPGVVNGEVILWEPEHELHPPADDEPVEVMEDRVAIAGNAIQTKDIHDTTFRFAKTLTTPFIGAGIVDLPPGSDKRPKNSRKMHMVFFLHSGKVLVTVNEASFRLSAGGMWFVPRGNYYSITNDYDKPARIFFSQGCEVTSQPTEGEQSQLSVMA